MLGLMVLLAACAGTPEPAQDLNQSAWGAQTQLPAESAAGGSSGWRQRAFPGKSATVYRAALKNGRAALSARATQSASMMQHRMRIAPQALGRLAFSWYVPALIDGADMARRDADDSPVRVVLAFDGDRSRLSPRDAMLSELAVALTGEPMPFATLMYVWCNQCPQEGVITNPRTDRIRKIALESGGGNLNRWLDYERDIRADYQRAFGEAPGPLIGVALMTDTDNTRSDAQAWYGPLRLLPVAEPAQADVGSGG